MDVTTRVLTTFQLWNKTFMEAMVTQVAYIWAWPHFAKVQVKKKKKKTTLSTSIIFSHKLVSATLMPSNEEFLSCKSFITSCLDD